MYDKETFCTCIATAALAVTVKMVSDYAETKPGLKNIKEKLKKTGKDFTADFKEVLEAAKSAFKGEVSAQALKQQPVNYE